MKHKAAAPALALIGGFLLSGQPAAKPLPPLGAPEVGVAAAGQTLRYSLSAPAASFLRISVNAFESQLHFVLRAASQTEIAEVSPVTNVFGGFELVTALKQAGTYYVEVSGPSQAPRIG